MKNKVFKVFQGRVKSLDEEKKTLEVVVSDETVDRYKEVILAEAWSKGLKNYKAHPVLLSSHSYGDLRKQIGMAKGIRVDKDSKELVAQFEYFVGEGNPEADWGWKLAQKGIAAFSVGFLPNKYDYIDEEEREKDGPYLKYTDVELLEVSQVLVPANPSAYLKDMYSRKGFDQEFIDSMVEEVRKSFKEEETIDLDVQTEIPDDADEGVTHIREMEAEKDEPEIPEKSVEEKDEPEKDLEEQAIEKEIEQETEKGLEEQEPPAKPLTKEDVKEIVLSILQEMTVELPSVEEINGEDLISEIKSEVRSTIVECFKEFKEKEEKVEALSEKDIEEISKSLMPKDQFDKDFVGKIREGMAEIFSFGPKDNE